MSYINNYPDELDLIELFNSEPYFKEIPEGNFSYIYTDIDGITLDFGFSIVEGWLSIFIKHNNNIVAHATYDRVEEFFIKNYRNNKYIQANIEEGAISVALKIYLEPLIRVETQILDNGLDRR